MTLTFSFLPEAGYIGRRFIRQLAMQALTRNSIPCQMVGTGLWLRIQPIEMLHMSPSLNGGPTAQIIVVIEVR